MTDRGCGQYDQNCADLNDTVGIATLSQRDLAYSASADQFFMPGLDLNTALFQSSGYTAEAIDTVGTFLQAGVLSLYLDLYWDSINQRWQLCPGAFPSGAFDDSLVYNVSSPTGAIHCQGEADFESVLQTIVQYIDATDTNIGVNLLSMVLRPRQLPGNSTAVHYISGDDSINGTVASIVSNRLFTPSDLRNTRLSRSVVSGGTLRTDIASQWPSLRNVLLTLRRRLVIYTDSFNVGNLGDSSASLFQYDSARELDASDPIVSRPKYTELSNVSFASMQVVPAGNSTAEFAAAVELGLSPIINTTITPGNALRQVQYNLWGWAQNEPSAQTDQMRAAMMRNGTITCCGVQTVDGWKVEDCHAQRRVLCKAIINPFMWKVYGDPTTYYDADCPDGFEFSVPQTPLEARAARAALDGSSDESFWIDINSLSVPNCWTTGGVQAVCPYNVVQRDRNGNTLIIILGVIVGCFVTVMSRLEWSRQHRPIHNRNAQRRRKLAAELEYEGVPS